MCMALLVRLRQSKRPDVALKVLMLMDSMQIEADIYHVSSVVSSFEKVGQWQQALSLFAEMPVRNIDPDVISYNAAISACEKGGAVSVQVLHVPRQA